MVTTLEHPLILDSVPPRSATIEALRLSPPAYRLPEQVNAVNLLFWFSLQLDLDAHLELT